MKTPIILLLTSDPTLEETVAQTLLEMSGISHLTLSPDEALQIISAMGHDDLALAVIDCEHGPYGIRLVSAIKDRRKDFPMIVITGDNEKCIEALAYANGATACFSKPVSAAQIKSVVNQYGRSQHQLEPLVT
jgi:CheY-like chemotaxis protein